MIRVVLITLLSHYRRHPGQLTMLLLGLWVAGALWSGVQAINASARDNYARAEALLGGDLVRLERDKGAPLTHRDFVALRRAGVPVSPLLEGKRVTDKGITLTLVGIDPFTLPAGSAFAGTQGRLQDFIAPPWQVRLAPETRAQLGESPRLQHGTALPPMVEAPGLPPNTLVMDIAFAARLLNAGEQITALILGREPAAVPAGYRLVRGNHRAGPGELTGSFHLNLTAMALLALIVGLFIVQAALGLALEQRLGLLRTLRALGVPGHTLVALLAGELLLLGVLGALAGLASGVWLAGALLPDVAATLQSLYGAHVSATLSLPWYYWLGGMGVTLGGLLIAGSGVLWRASRLPLLGLGQAQAWRAGFQRQLRVQIRLGAVAALLALGGGLWLMASAPGEGLLAGFGLVAALLLAAALWLPPLLAGVLALLLRLMRRRPLIQWALADMQLQLPRLSLAMMALLIALAANLGVNSMVGGFRLTFLDWLDRRLLADLYLRPPAAQFEEINTWLSRRADVQARLISTRADAELLDVNRRRSSSLPVAVSGITPAPGLVARWPLLTFENRQAAWQALRRGDVFINEQLARREGIGLGDELHLAASGSAIRVTVAGIYPDYGNPKGELVMTTERVQRLFGVPPLAIGVVLAPGMDAGMLRQALSARFALSVNRLQDQREVKATATAIFERTFAITHALNGLTLAVAALALLASLLAQASALRRRLATTWALGVPRYRLVGIQLTQLAGVALFTGLLALPLGVAITACLVWGINVAAFGWRLPLHLFPGEMALTLVIAVLVALLAAALPMLKLWRTPPRAMLAEEENP